MTIVATFDVGKTNSRLVATDLRAMEEIWSDSISSPVSNDPPYPHIDTERLWEFLLESLRKLVLVADVSAISVTAHGSAAALVDKKGGLVLPVMDYEFDGPDQFAAEYDKLRPNYDVTGSPRMPQGLNLGAQIYWQAKTFPEQFAKACWILTWPQYWAMRLTGKPASEVTSLGACSDLWEPETRKFSNLVCSQGWKSMFAPIHKAYSILGCPLPEVVGRTGIAPDLAVLSGVHDTNAALFTHLCSRRKPFSVISTGTWIIVIAVGARLSKLNPSQGHMLNVDVNGDATPSIQFMGGREYQILTKGHTTAIESTDVETVLRQKIMHLPTVVPGSGPFPAGTAKWLNDSQMSAAHRQIAASYYLAMMTSTCLELTNAKGDIIVEGPMTENTNYLDLLALSSGRTVVARAAAGGSRLGAALLAMPDAGYKVLAGDRVHEPPTELACALDSYAEAWRIAVDC